MSNAKPRDTLQAVTANRLSDGIVVYLDRDQGWTTSLADAALAETPAAASELMAGAELAVEARLVVGPYLIGILPAGRGPRRLRERIRQGGPTVGGGYSTSDRER